MPTTIKLRNSVTTTSAPSSLVQGEVAINITDKKVWVGNAATTPIQLLGDGGSASFTSIAFGAGTVSSPSITFTGDTNTGIYSPAADTIAFTEGGVESMRIDSSGNVGIAVSPSAWSGYNALQIRAGSLAVDTGSFLTLNQNAVNASGGWTYINTGTAEQYYQNAGTHVWRSAASGTAGTAISFTERMRIDSSGNVGIGMTPSGDSRLEVYSADSATIYKNVNTGTGASDGFYVGMGKSSATEAYVYNRENNNLIFGTNNTERMRITSGGDVVIGTTASLSSYKTTIQHTSGELLGLNASSGTLTRIAFGNADTSFGATQIIANSTSLALITGSAERMRITSGGIVGIGITNPAPTGVLVVNGEGGSSNFDQGINTRLVDNNTGIGGGAALFGINCARTATGQYRFMQCNSGTNSGGTFGDAEFRLDGDGNAYADGTWSNNGADYAEYFESVTGQSIPVGSTVVLENNKIRLATVSDNPADVIGVVRPKEPSKASMMVGNTAWNKWTNKYLTDDFDRYIMEDHDVIEWTDEDGEKHYYDSHTIPSDVVVPSNAIIKTHDVDGKKYQHYKLNPAWNPDAEYTNRENREEWLIIGLVGQVKVLKGQVMGERWKKMRDVSETVEEWFIR